MTDDVFNNDKLLVDSHRAANILRMSPKQFSAAVATGKIPKRLHNGTMRYDIDELRDYVDAQRANSLREAKSAQKPRRRRGA